MLTTNHLIIKKLIPSLCCRTGKFFLFFFIFLCSDLVIKAQLKAQFSATSQSGCAPLIVYFNDASTGNPTSWTWNLGNGTTSVLQNPAATYFDPGTYTVKLIVKNVLGIDSIIKIEFITVYAAPVINFDATKITGCFPLITQFSDISFAGSGSLTQWQWDFGDGNSSPLQNPDHTYTSLGNYNVSLMATNSFGCITSKTIPSYIKISSGSSAQFSSSSSNSCKAPATINFLNNSTGTGALQYQWNFGDGTSSTLTNPSHVYTSAGTFGVTLVVTNAAGCTDTLVKPNLITIGETLADFAALATVCQGTAVDFTNMSKPPPGSVSWDFGDGTFSNQLSPVKAFSNVGTYYVKMVANFGSCKDSVTKTIMAIESPKPEFTASQVNACKAPLTVSFTSSSSIASTYFWDFGDGNTSTAQNPSHTYLTLGSFPVKLIITNAAGCRDSIIKTDFINIRPPAISINDLPQKGCAPLSHDFSARISPLDIITNYQWNFGDGTSSTSATPTHIYNTSGNYTVTLIYTTQGGCTDSVTKNIEVFPLPNLSIQTNTPIICRGNSTPITVSGAQSYSWSPSTTLSCNNCNNPTAQPDSNMYYKVVGTSNKGCHTSDSILIQVKQRFNISVNPSSEAMRLLLI